MKYSILSAHYANEDHTAAIIVTAETAAVAISEIDTPEEWAAMLKWGEPTAYVPAEPAEPPKTLDDVDAALKALEARVADLDGKSTVEAGRR